MSAGLDSDFILRAVKFNLASKTNLASISKFWLSFLIIFKWL